MADTYRYAAFISYSSRDAAFARRLHRTLESYRIPTALGAFDLTGSGRKNRLYPIFRDREELPAGELGVAIESALRESASLIVVCSPNAAASQWVDKEIEFFLNNGRRDRVFAIIAPDAPLDVDGADATAASFPSAFRTDAFEPIAADARKGKDGYRAAWLKIVAGLCAVNAGALADRDAKQQMQRRVGIGVAAALSVFALGSAAVWATTQNAVSVQAARLVQEAIRNDDPILAALAAQSPNPLFRIDAQPALDFLNGREALALVSAGELRDARALKLDDPEIAAPLRAALPHISISRSTDSVIDLSVREDCVDEVARRTSIATRAGTGRCVHVAGIETNARRIDLVLLDDQRFEALSADAVIWSLPFTQIAEALPAAAAPAAPAPEPQRFAGLFGLVPLASQQDAVRPEVLAWNDGARMLVWTSAGNVFAAPLERGASVRAARLPHPAFNITWLGGEDWLVGGATQSSLVRVGADAIAVTPIADTFGVGLSGFSRAHGVGIAPDDTETRFFRYAEGAFTAIRSEPAFASDVMVSSDGAWLATYGTGGLRVFDAVTLSERLRIDMLRATRGEFFSFGTLDDTPVALGLDLDGELRIASLTDPPAFGSDAFVQRLCAGIDADKFAQAELIVRAVGSFYTPQFEHWRTRCADIG